MNLEAIMIRSMDREDLLRIASDITVEVNDAHRVVDNARDLEAWVSAADSHGDAELRMTALRRVHCNLIKSRMLPDQRDDDEQVAPLRPVDVIDRAAVMYEYLKGAEAAPDKVVVGVVLEDADEVLHLDDEVLIIDGKEVIWPPAD